MNAELEADIKHALPAALKMALYTAKKQNYEILKYSLESVDSLSNNASLLKDWADEDHMTTLEATTKEFVVLEAQLGAYKAQLEKLESAVEKGNVNPKDYDKLVNACKTKPNVNFAKNDMYKRFCEKAGIEVEEDADADVVFQDSESARSTICPVTQMEIENPVRNPACGHTYSDQGIRSHLRHRSNCPVAGCPHKVVVNNLERDVEMEVLIERRKNATQQRKRQSASAPSFRDDNDDEEEEEEYVVD